MIKNETSAERTPRVTGIQRELLRLTGYFFLPQGSSGGAALEENSLLTPRGNLFGFFYVSTSNITVTLIFVCKSVFWGLFFYTLFLILKKENCTSFSGVKDKLGAGLSPNHHVGSIPVIQFGNLPASKSASLSSNRLVGKIYVSLTLNSNLCLFVIHHL